MNMLLVDLARERQRDLLADAEHQRPIRRATRGARATKDRAAIHGISARLRSVLATLVLGLLARS